MHTFEQYKTMVKQTGRLEDNELPKIRAIRFDRAAKRLHLFGCSRSEPFVRQIAEALTSWERKKAKAL